MSDSVDWSTLPSAFQFPSPLEQKVYTFDFLRLAVYCPNAFPDPPSQTSPLILALSPTRVPFQLPQDRPYFRGVLFLVQVPPPPPWRNFFDLLCAFAARFLVLDEAFIPFSVSWPWSPGDSPRTGVTSIIPKMPLALTPSCQGHGSSVFPSFPF